ncbi:MAG: HAD family hydrolase [Lysobacterales bacterium 69-70]|nr:HAD family hydrolase [Xanthomonadaceae bacterium]ODU31498.1 MAG: HAD family hydrolase [Xanthomonadaceae bacterium SCN 69-320]ODV16995.1 MAG: HAD family hydrolase [Xanthomonadaceae bacterium SCN 69-25]OJY95711.1 MAG: HAD family hydrolase [Xanthomonadales bacterium 69-70]
MQIRAISLDLDDTLWPIAPIVQRAEQRLHDWLLQHCPPVAAAYPIAGMRALRERIAEENPQLAHDYTAQRKLSLSAALRPHGYGEDTMEAAFDAFYAARNEVELYADALPALQRLAARLPLVSLSNGNADLGRIGLRHLFADCVSAREFGTAKPAPEIFHEACRRLGLAPQQVLHVGDDPLLDVHGARGAGLPTVWLNRDGLAWSQPQRADLEFRTLTELADWLELRQAA